MDRRDERDSVGGMKTLLIVLAMGCAVGAEELPKFDVLNVGTKTYRSVKVTAVEPSGIRFSHESGAALAKFEELEPDIRSKFTFDPAAAKKFEAEQAALRRKAAFAAQQVRQDEELAAAVKKAPTIHIEAKIQQVMKDGLLLSQGHWFEPGFRHDLDGAKVLCNPSGHAEGEWIEADVFPAGTFEYRTVLGASRTVKFYILGAERYKQWLTR